MEELDALDHLVSDHADGLEGELALAEGEEVLQGGAQQVHHHAVVVAFYAEPVHCWDTHYIMSENERKNTSTNKDLIKFSLIEQLRELGFCRFLNIHMLRSQLLHFNVIFIEISL